MTASPPRPAGPLIAAGVFARRYLLRLRRSPDLIAISILQPILFMLVFAFVLGGAIDVPAVSYVQYFLPGVLVQTAAFIALGSTSAGLAEELAHGAVELPHHARGCRGYAPRTHGRRSGPYLRHAGLVPLRRADFSR